MWSESSEAEITSPILDPSSPESQGLPACCVYLLALFCFIPFRYYLGSEGKEQSPQTISDNGGWSGDMTGRQGFPHHEVSTGGPVMS